jgi:DNA helicase-2/ATP-dependent DNA helicase PcrA
MNVRHEEMATAKDIKAFGKKLGVELTGYLPELTSLEIVDGGFRQPTKADRLLQLNHLGRHRGLKLKDTLRDAPLELDFAYAKWFTQAYSEWKYKEGKYDYTDLLTRYLGNGPILDIDVLFVDEGQDLSWLQWAVVRKLSVNVKRRYLSGDDDQCIYVWAGASAELFNTEPADEVIVLPQSYRIPSSVHELSQRIISRVKLRQPKEFKPRDSRGLVKPAGLLGSDLLQHPGTTLVLFRNHHRGQELSRIVEELGIPFIGNYSPLSKDDVRLALSGWRKATTDEAITLPEAKSLVSFAMDQYLQPGARQRANSRTGEFKASSFFTNEALAKPWHQVIPRLPGMRFIDRAITRYGWENTLNPKVSLISIHQSKGREADTVVLDLEMANRTYEAYLKEPQHEHRVYYVAVTRARERLFTLMPTDPKAYQL